MNGCQTPFSTYCSERFVDLMTYSTECHVVLLAALLHAALRGSLRAWCEFDRATTGSGGRHERRSRSFSCAPTSTRSRRRREHRRATGKRRHRNRRHRDGRAGRAGHRRDSKAFAATGPLRHQHERRSRSRRRQRRTVRGRAVGHSDRRSQRDRRRRRTGADPGRGERPGADDCARRASRRRFQSARGRP